MVVTSTCSMVLKMKIFWVSLLIAQMQASNCLNLCDQKWTKVLETNSSGVPVFGFKADLIDALKNGADVRVYNNKWGGSRTGYASITNNAYFRGGEVCVQLLMHVSKAGWDSFQSNVYWWFVNLCTTGHVHMTRYYIGSHTKVSDTKTTVQMTWFIRKTGSCGSINPEPVLCHTAEGLVACGNALELSDAISKGSDVRLVSKQNSQTGYTTSFSNIETSGSLISGQALWHLSQTFVGNHIEFQSDAYWWFTMWSSDGTRDMSRWSVGEHTDRSHTNDKVASDWFVDSCWSLAYRHDQNGNNIDGSLDYLISAAQNGHRVKLVMDSYSIESDNVQIRNNHLSAQLLGHVSKNGPQLFQDNAYWYWQHVSTTGSFDTVRYNVGSTTNRGNSNGTQAVSWFIDNRPWKHVLSTSASGSVTFGSVFYLINAVEAGSAIRYTIHLPNEKLILSADNIGISTDGFGLAAQTIRTVSYTNDNVRKFQSNPYWRLIIADSYGMIKESRWTVGSHQSRGTAVQKVAMDWFVD